MVRFVRPIALLAAALVAASAVPDRARAQATDSSRGGLRLRTAVGTDLGIGDSYLAGRVALGVVGVEWLHRRAPFSARLDLSYFRRAEDYGNPTANGCTEFCRAAERYEMFGLSLDGRYTFFSRAPIRPYLLSGFGLFSTRTVTTANYTCDDFTCVAAPAGSTFTAESISPALHAGFGLAVPVRRSELSLELRFQQLSAGGYRRHTLPVTLGIRF